MEQNVTGNKGKIHPNFSRKNSQHRKEFYHPSTEDESVESKDGEDDEQKDLKIPKKQEENNQEQLNEQNKKQEKPKKEKFKLALVDSDEDLQPGN